MKCEKCGSSNIVEGKLYTGTSGLVFTTATGLSQKEHLFTKGGKIVRYKNVMNRGLGAWTCFRKRWTCSLIREKAQYRTIPKYCKGRVIHTVVPSHCETVVLMSRREGEIMPLVRVDMIKGKTSEYKKTVLNCIHRR